MPFSTMTMDTVNDSDKDSTDFISITIFLLFRSTQHIGKFISQMGIGAAKISLMGIGAVKISQTGISAAVDLPGI
jgi:hypothetical protein